MNAKMKKAKGFVKEHKKELAIAAVTVVGGAIVFAITRKQSETIKKDMDRIHEAFTSTINEWRDLDKSVIELGTIESLDTNGEWIDAIVNDISVSDLGKLGEELVKLEGVNSETGVSAMISVLTNDVKVETF